MNTPIFDLSDLQYFVAIVRAGGFSKAAEKLFVAQPFLSRKIHVLEDRLGVTLLERTTRQMRLTSAGEEFYQHAVHILIECEELEATLRPDRAPAREIRLGYGSIGQLAFVMRMTSILRRDDPELFVSAEACDSLEPLFAGKLHVALLMACEAHRQDWLECIPVEKAGLSFFVAATDPLAQSEGTISISQVLTRRFLLPRPRNVSALVPCKTLYDAIRQQLLLHGIRSQNIEISNGMQAFSLAIIGSTAVGVMPDSSAVITNPLLACHPMTECRSGFEIVLAWPRFGTPPALAQKFRSVAAMIARENIS